MPRGMRVDRILLLRRSRPRCLSGCATLQQLTPLHSVRFEFSNVSDVRIAGIPIGAQTSFRSLSVADAARLSAAVLAHEVPLELVAHVDATNPAENSVTARMVALDWSLFIEDRRTLTGGLVNPVTIASGATSDVPLKMRLDLLRDRRGRRSRPLRPGPGHRRARNIREGPASRLGPHDRDAARPDPLSGADHGAAHGGLRIQPPARAPGVGRS